MLRQADLGFIVNMPEFSDMRLSWRPEMGDGSPSLHEAASLQKGLNRVYGRESGMEKAREIPISIWLQARKALIAAELPGFGKDELEVRLEGKEMRIRAAHAGQEGIEGSFTLPFTPKPETIRTRYMDGVLFVQVERDRMPPS
jgi:HSP20 family molecular chaperone IbpA